MQNNTRFFLYLILIVILGFGGYLLYSNGESTPPAESPETSVVYKNTDYGFNFSLPANWQGYSIVTEEWKGYPLSNTATQGGPKIIIRNPKWTVSAKYEDLPILIFTIPQWDSYMVEDFSIGAAPIKASELARNNKYVFALPARWDFDYSLDFKEAQDIFTSKPLQVFDVKN